MELRQLEYFMAAVEQRSLGRAALAMNISQPAISKAIRRLELELGVPLLNRLPRGVDPTQFGDFLAVRGSAVQHALERIELELEAMKSGHMGKVVVGVGSSMRLTLLPEALLRVSGDHPEAEYKIVSKLYDGLLPDVQRGEIEFALCQVSAFDLDDDLAEIPLYSDSIRPTVRKGHPLLSKKNLTAEDCLDFDWVLPAPEHLGYRRLENIFHSINLPAPKPVVESDSTLFSIALIKRCDMISWHPTQVIAENADDVAAIPLPEIAMHRDVGILHQKDAPFSPLANVLIEQIKFISGEMIENGLASAV